MKRLAPVAIVMFGVLTISRAPFAAASGDLESAKALYASASYEEALATLNDLQGAEGVSADPIQVNQYRALCLLALGRADEAEAPLQQIVAANPLYVVPADQVSPKLVDLFHDVRRKVLPTAARDLYTKAKASYDAKNTADAAAQFKMLIAVLSDPDTRESASGSADMKVLAEGFLALLEAQVAPPPPAKTPSAPVQDAADANRGDTPANAAAADRGQPVIFSASDAGVTPPIERSRIMPRWIPANAADRQITRRGVLRIVIDQEGRVESAALVTPLSPTFDADLLRLAKTWRYSPATREGVPVKFAMTFEIVLSPTAAARE